VKNRFRSIPSLVAGAAIVLTGACGDSTGPGGSDSGDPLSAAEAQEVSTEVLTLLSTTAFSGVGTSEAVQLTDLPGIRFSVSAAPIETKTASCEGGGTVSVSGEVSLGSNSATFDLTETITNCVVQGSTSTFTVNGDPNVNLSGSMSSSGETFTIDWKMRGGFKYTSGGSRTGSCSVSVDIKGTVDLNNLTNPNAITVSGSVCGQSITTLG